MHTQDYTALDYPFKVKTSAKLLEELYQCEFGRYEDAVEARKTLSNEEVITEGYNWVFCDFGNRFKTQLEIRCEQELEETLYALNTGTIELFMPRAAERLEDSLTRIILGKAPRASKPKQTKEQKQARVEFQSAVQKCTDKCTRFLIKNNMVKSPKLFKKYFKAETKNIRGCWGGLSKERHPRITISTKYMEATGTFTEYKHIAGSDFIGSFYSDNNDDHLMAIVAHEIAHAVIHWNGLRTYFRDDGKAHGAEWQKVYKELRIKFKLVGMPRTEQKRRVV